MTLTGGHAAENCFVGRPTLGVAIKNLEGDLGVQLFERRKQDVSVTRSARKSPSGRSWNRGSLPRDSRQPVEPLAFSNS